MFRFLSALLGMLTLVAVGGVALVLVLLQPTPLVATNAELAPAELRNLAALVKAADRNVGGIKTIVLTPPKLDGLVDLAARRLGGHARLRPGHGGAAVLASFPVGRDLGYANLHIELRETAGIPAVAAASLGGLSLPVKLVDRLLNFRLDRLAPAGQLLRVDFSPQQAQLVYRLHGDAKAAAVALLGDTEQRRLSVRQAQLAKIVAEQHRAGHIDLAVLLSALLAQPTGVEGADGRADTVADNRAALVVLAAYVNGRRLPVRGAAARPEPRTVILSGRHDLAQHFSISAAVAAKGGSDLSHLVGLAKELSDADGGSGFSFADMLANRAGIRFAELATASPESADLLRRMAGAGLKEADIMPTLKGLPEGMQQATLVRTIGTPSSVGYARLIDHIDRRIDTTRLHRAMPSG